jgi:hypothetical protein
MEDLFFSEAIYFPFEKEYPLRACHFKIVTRCPPRLPSKWYLE